MRSRIAPDDYEDLKDSSTALIGILSELNLNDYFSAGIIGSVFLKVSIVNAERDGLSLESFINIVRIYYSEVEKMRDAMDNQKMNGSETEYPNGNERQES